MPSCRSRIQLRTRSSTRRAAFFAHLSDIRWTPFAIALGFLLAMQLCRAWAWRNVLRAAYPGERRSPSCRSSAAYLAGAGINAIIPAHAGDVTKVFLVKRQIPDSSYPAVTSSFLVQTVFDTTVGILVLALRDHPGPAAAAAAAAPPAGLRDLLLGRPPADAADRRRRPADRRSRSAIYYLAHRVRRFWDRVKQGAGHPHRSRAATCARSPPGRGSAGSAASAPSGSSSRRSASAARSATCCW